jgi:hypothetical protein
MMGMKSGQKKDIFIFGGLGERGDVWILSNIP